MICLFYLINKRLNYIKNILNNKNYSYKINIKTNKLIMNHARTGYLPHIDGLRAIAVLSVVFHHFSPEIVPGGYIGVDIFFVISGYLIAGIIKKEIEENRFSFIDFYERRVRRIFPALFSVLIFTIILSYYYLLPSDFIVTLRGLVGTLFFFSNLVFWKDFEAGYFAATSEGLIPLVHTWSLSVEEQFYLIFPLFLFVLYKFKFKIVTIVFSLVLILFISLFLSEYFIDNKPVAVFFLTPFRIWELLVGVMLVFNVLPIIRNRVLNELLSIIAFSMIIYPSFFYNNLTIFPGISALLPVVGSAMIIHLGKNGNTFIKSILEFKLILFIGLISYSLYLWHWPILVFSNHLDINYPILDNIFVLLIISIIISSLSYFYIEQPFRGKRGLKFISRSKVFYYSGILLLILSIFCFYGILNKGLEKRFSSEIINFDKARNPEIKYKKCDNIYNPDNWCVVGKKEYRPETIFFGDSHLLSWGYAIDEIFLDRNEGVLLAPLSGCPPFFDIIYSGSEFRKNDTCVKRSKDLEDFLKTNNHIKNVVLVGAWPGYFRGWKKFTVEIEGIGTLENELAAKEALQNTIEKINKLNKNVILLGPVPVYEQSVPLAHANALIQKSKFDEGTLKSQIEFNSIFYDYVNKNEKQLKFIDPLKWSCKLKCTTLVNGQSIYHDSNHLNRKGSLFFKEQFASELNILLEK